MTVRPMSSRPEASGPRGPWSRAPSGAGSTRAVVVRAAAVHVAAAGAGLLAWWRMLPSGALAWASVHVLLATTLVWALSARHGARWAHARERRWIFAGVTTAASAVSLCVTAALVTLATAVTDGAAAGDAPSSFLLLALGVVLVSGVPLLTFVLALLLGPGGRATEAA